MGIWDRVVAADSCSGSFQPAESLYYMGLILIGVIKYVSCKFPMDNLIIIEFYNSGNFCGLVSEDVN